MAKYIVTGGYGFIGSWIAQRLLDEGNQVVIIDDLSSGKRSNVDSIHNLTFLNVDIANWNALSKCFNYFKGADGVFHLAAKARIQPSIHDPSSTHDSNVNGTFNILEMMRMTGVKKIVYSASSSSYGLKATLPNVETQPADCLNPYAISKYVGELYLKTWGKMYGISNVCLKYFNVYGEKSPIDDSVYAPVIGLFFVQALKRIPLSIIGDGEQKRDFTYISDVVEANVLAMTKADELSGLTINIGTGVNYTINEVAKIVKETVEKIRIRADVSIQYIPPRPAEIRETLADISLAKEKLGWQPKVMFRDIAYQLGIYYGSVLSTFQGKEND